MKFRQLLPLLLLVAGPIIANAAVPLEAGLSFQPMTISVGGTSVMSIEISNPNDIAASGLAVRDVYPGGVFNASPVTVSSTCDGTFTAAAGASSFSFSGGTLAARSTCILAVGVSAAQGLWVNALDPGSVTSVSVPANAFFSTALLIVDGGPVPPPPPKPLSVAASFTPSSIHAGKTTTLSIAFTNPNAAAKSIPSLITDYPSALINTPEGARSGCGGTATAKPGSRTLDFSGGTVPANSTCRVDVVIRGSSPGEYVVTVGGKSARVTVSSSEKQ